MSRRGFLAAGGAAALAAGVQGGPARAQAPAPAGVQGGPAQTQPTAPSARKYVRMNLSDPRAAGALQSYQDAITAMLRLPPTDPRNWYRNAFIHLLDCPHGNWWFLPWHRGYLGWFEQTCRALSGDPYFALPYWDWTADLEADGGQFLSVPPAFSNPNTVLHPSNSAYIDSFAAFQQQFTGPVDAFYAGLTQGQKDQLAARGLATAADFWSAATSMFFPLAQARQSNFDSATLGAVALPTILAALAPNTFTDFGSAKAQGHSDGVGFGILEGQPHNNIHVAVGGFMSDFLSPVDPIFFMHHGNIDRLWDVWTRKQQALSLPTLPEGADLTAWQQEPFLFFIDRAGQPVANDKAGDYATIGQFNYRYRAGSGEQVVGAAVAPRVAEREFQATLSRNALDFQEPAIATARVPAALTQPAAAGANPPLFARVTIQPPDNPRGVRFHVLVNPPEGVRNLNFQDPSFAGTFTFFGSHTHGRGHDAKPITFDVALTGAVQKLRAAGKLKADEPLRVQVVPDTAGVTVTPFQVPLKSVAIRTL
jgi:hypothetical protein